eukprot:scaffold188914_cov20-Prasinocladus_malaysianus.AAC.1
MPQQRPGTAGRSHCAVVPAPHQALAGQTFRQERVPGGKADTAGYSGAVRLPEAGAKVGCETDQCNKQTMCCMQHSKRIAVAEIVHRQLFISLFTASRACHKGMAPHSVISNAFDQIFCPLTRECLAFQFQITPTRFIVHKFIHSSVR